MSDTSDGVVKSTFRIRTKLGEYFDLVSFEPRRELLEKIVETLNKKECLVFPTKDEGRDMDVIFPYDIVLDVRLKDFSELVTGKIVTPINQQRR